MKEKYYPNQYQRNIESWEIVRNQNPDFDTKVWETVEPTYDQATNQTNIKYQKYIKRKNMGPEVVANREWNEEGDARPRLREAQYLGGLTIDQLGEREEWGRESFDYLTNYQYSTYVSNNLIPQLVNQLNQLPASSSELSELEAVGLLKPVMTLAEILQYQEILTQAHENDTSEIETTERVVRKCLKLPAVPLTKHVPLGF